MEVSIRRDRGQEPFNNRECPDHIGAGGTYALFIPLGHVPGYMHFKHLYIRHRDHVPGVYAPIV